MFQSLLFYFYDSSFPRRTVRIRQDDPEWMTASPRLLLIDDRGCAFHKKQWLKHSRLKLEVQRHIRKLKGDFLSSFAASKIFKQLWQSLRRPLVVFFELIPKEVKELVLKFLMTALPPISRIE